MVALSPNLKPLELVYEGSGLIAIPIDRYLWPEKPIIRRDFVLSRVQLRYIRRYQEAPWIDRARTQAFWQCKACGWKPWPIPAKRWGRQLEDANGNLLWDDSVWLWFSDQSWKARQEMVENSKSIRALEREIRRSPRIIIDGLEMRVNL